jgi:membrane fusion protein, multidrug efflux system
MNPLLNSILRIVLGAAILLVAFLFMKGLISMKTDPPVSIPPKAVKEVRTMKAEIGNFQPETFIQGRAVAKQKIELYSEVNGRLLSSGKDFREGVKYQAGEVIFRLDSEELRLQLVAQKSGFLQLLTSNLAEIKLDFADRYEVWSQYTNDLDVNAALENLPEPASDKEKYFLSNRGILNQYYSIRSSEERLAKYTIRAPFSGVVSSSLVNAGTLVRPGQKLGEFMNTTEFEVEAAVLGSALSVVKVGDEVGLKAEDNSGDWNGRVSRISNYIDPTTQTAKVFVSVKGESLKDGMYLNGVIRSAPMNDVLRLQTDLLTAENQVYAVKDSSLVLMRPLVVHQSLEHCLLSGIPSGTTLLAEPLPNAFDGMRVKPVAQ